MSRQVDLTQPGAGFWETHNLDDHVALMKRQVTRSLDDPETHRLARQIRRGLSNIVTAWGREYRATPRTASAGDSDCCDIALVWNFCVLNVRYMHDPADFDLFCTVRHTLEAGVGDCDDMTILQGALLKSLGFREVFARVISVDGRRWAHVYAVVSGARSGGAPRIALDPTVRGATPGWEFEQSKKTRDFRL